MSKIARYQGNVRAFASDAEGMERTVFGGTNQADDLTSQITASFLRGWGIVGASEHPSLEDFNAAMYAMSQFIAYQHQMGIPEWHAEQEYHLGSICTHNGESYQSLQNANVGSQPPSAKWTPVLTSKNGLANLGLANAVIGDSVKHIGFSTNDVKKPYFRFPDTDSVILLATQQALGGKQDSDATLSALAGLTGAANKLAYFTGADTASLTDLTQVGRDIIGKSDIAAVIQYLGLANAVIGDGTKNAGFSGGDAAKPYMRHTQSDSVIFLATTSQLIGIDQTYRVVTDKVLGVTYTNTSKRPWFVSLKVNLPASAEVLIKVDGVMAGGGNAANNAGTSVWAYPSAIIPPGATYVVTAPGGTLIQWVELK